MMPTAYVRIRAQARLLAVPVSFPCHLRTFPFPRCLRIVVLLLGGATQKAAKFEGELGNSAPSAVVVRAQYGLLGIFRVTPAHGLKR